MIRTLGRTLPLALLLACFAALQSPAMVRAHAEPERAEPPMGGTVTAVPVAVEIWFDEEVTGETTIEVLGPDGERVDLGDAALDLDDPERRHVTVLLPADLPSGTYTVEWRSVSGADDDAAEGSYTFTLDAGTPVASPEASPVASPEATPADAEGTPAASVSGTDGGTGFDDRAFGLGLLAGLGAALVIYGFWLLVRPKRAPLSRD